MYATMVPRNPFRTTSLTTTFRILLNDSKWRRSPATSRSGGEVGSSRCYTRCIGRGSPNRSGSGNWAFNSLAPTFCAFAPAFQTSTAKPNSFTAGCAKARPRVSFPGTTVNGFLALGHACIPRAEWLRRYRDTVLPKGAHVWCKGDDGLWWLGKVSASMTEDGAHLVRVLDDP